MQARKRNDLVESENLMALNRKVRAFGEAFPSVGMSGTRGWTNLEIKRALLAIGCGSAVGASEYSVAMGYFWRAAS
jgi:hypothetical protein